MISGIGTDICKVSRFEKWVKQPELFLRWFNEKELYNGDATKNLSGACCHYAARFAAKEAFSKALGTGFSGLRLSDFYVAKDSSGKPYFEYGEYTKKILEEKLGNKFNIQLSISHEKEFATAFVIIEIIS